MAPRLVTNKKPEVKKKVVRPVDFPELALKFPKGKKVILKADGCMYQTSNSFGAEISGPMTREEVCEAVTGNIGIKPPDPVVQLLKPPVKEFAVPLGYVREWARQLLDDPRENLLLYGVSRKDPTKWLGVVPEQEVTGGSVDVDDFGKAASQLSQKGFRIVGTLHTHPGGMTGCSGTDTGELWNRIAGVHLIVTHTGILSWWFSSRTITWDLKEYESFQHVELWEKGIPKPHKKGCFCILGEDGTFDYQKLITKPFSFGYVGYKSDWWEKDKKAQKGKNKTYSNVPSQYYGYWDQNRKEMVFHEQKKGVWVSEKYTTVWGGYFDKIMGRYYAGTPRKFEKKNHVLIPKEFKSEKKKTSTGDHLVKILDWLEEQKDLSQLDTEYHVQLNEKLVDLGFAFENLETFLMDTIGENLDPSPSMKSSLIRVLLLLPSFGKFIWGAEAKNDKEYSSYIPKEWKG